MADLKMDVAQGLVGYLIGIGHPYQPAAVNATALLLMKWCKGTFAGGVPISPEQQAKQLVEEAAETWDGWPEKGGTKQLLDLFRAKFAPKPKELTADEMIALFIKRGDFAPPCGLCRQEGAKFCEYGGERRHAKTRATKLVIDVTTSPAQPKPSINLDQLIARGQASWENEQHRKKQQLEKVGCD